MQASTFYVVVFSLLLSGCVENRTPAPVEYHHIIEVNDTKPQAYDENTIITRPLKVSDVQEAVTGREDVGQEVQLEDEHNPKVDVKEDSASKEWQHPTAEPDQKNLAEDPKIVNVEKKNPEVVQNKNYKFIKPVNAGKMISNFGENSNGINNKGINIAVEAGTKIVSSTDGSVIYADYDATYGNLVIIKMTNENIVTAYAHLEEIIVEKGQKIVQGEIIGYVGQSGKVNMPQLYFAIREGKTPVDPKKYINFK
jgi:murein DD-endopeptidase MepM/ murein hydrolase activator NlpD